MAVAMNALARGLPAEVTSFVGRRREVADVKRLLSRSRLVTLTGVGGVGKTRLAFRVAAEVRRAFPDGVWLVELASLENPELLAYNVLHALGTQNNTPRPALDVLIDHLRDRSPLIVLDNCEHLLNECAALVTSLLRSVPGLRILATSRQVLGIAGEQTLAVPALSLPASDTGPLPTEAFAQYDAVRLFSERARAVLPDFTVTADNRDTVERICRRLDGIPLAIELAAVRLRVLSLRQLLDRLDDRFKLLGGGSEAAPPRHRTLRALIDWSYTLCTPQERLLWARASVFSGGLDLEAAEAVCSGDGIARDDVLGLVSGLVDKSVLVRDETPPGSRYRLLETIRQYGRERLAESGEEAGLQRRHRDHYQELAADARARLFGPSQLPLLKRLKADNANLRSALDYCFGHPGEEGVGMAIAADLLYHWITGYLGEGRRRLAQALAADHEPGPLRGRALLINCWLAVIQGETVAAEAMLVECHGLGDDLDESLLAGIALYSGLIAMDRCDGAAAVGLCEEAVARHQGTGDLSGLAQALGWLSAARTLVGDTRAAAVAASEGISLCDVHNEGLHRAYLLTMLGIARWREGDTWHATALAKESLAFHASLMNPRGIALDLALLAWCAAADGRHERAGRLLGVLQALSRSQGTWQAIGVPVSGYRHLNPFHAECQAEVLRALGESGLDTAARRGSGMPIGDALAYALQEEDAPAEKPGTPSPLTRRELEISRLIARGMSNKQIAAELVISQRTVEGHVEHMLTKLGFCSRTQIAVWTEQEDPHPDDPANHRERHVR